MEFSGEREVSVVVLANIMLERAGCFLTRCGTAGKSYSNTTNEIILLTCESMLLIWSILNVIVFLSICKEYRKDTIIFLQNVGIWKRQIETDNDNLT